MSSTNRGYERHKADYYITPQKDVDLFLTHFIKEVLNIPYHEIKKLSFLDPCCGGDNNNKASYINVIKDKFNPVKLLALDIRQDSKADIKTDYLKYTTQENFDVIISNPPFYLAEDFIKKSIELISENGYVIMLLRLNFFGSKKRKIIFENNMPKYCFIHHKRISFNKTSTDSIEYAHFVWVKKNTNNFCKTFVI